LLGAELKGFFHRQGTQSSPVSVCTEGNDPVISSKGEITRIPEGRGKRFE
jgi:hypothetical protein